MRVNGGLSRCTQWIPSCKIRQRASLASTASGSERTERKRSLLSRVLPMTLALDLEKRTNRTPECSSRVLETGQTYCALLATIATALAPFLRPFLRRTSGTLCFAEYGSTSSITRTVRASLPGYWLHEGDPALLRSGPSVLVSSIGSSALTSSGIAIRLIRPLGLALEPRDVDLDAGREVRRGCLGDLVCEGFGSASCHLASAQLTFKGLESADAPMMSVLPDESETALATSSFTSGRPECLRHLPPTLTSSP